MFLAASVAVTVTVVVPMAKVLPDAGPLVTDTLAQLSVAGGGGYVTTAPAGLVASAVMFAGVEGTGGVVSFTVTVWLHDD